MKHILNIFFITLVSFSIHAQKEELTLSDAILKQYREFYPQRTLMFKWIPQTSNYTYLSSNYQSLMMGSIKGDDETELINTTDIQKITGEKIPWMNVLEWKNDNQFYIQAGHKYFLINISDKTGNLVSKANKLAENSDFNTFSGKIAYTIENDLYYTGTKMQANQVTFNGEETVSGQAIARSEFGITKGIFWAPEGNFLAFYEKDESDVADYPLLNINSTPGTLNNIKYPMAGQKSEYSKVGIVNTEKGTTIYITPQGASEDYLTNLGWNLDGSSVFIAEVNRDQNHMKLNQYDPRSGQFIKTLFEEKSDKWTEPEHPVYFINDTEFIWMSERDGFMNLYLYDIKGKLVKQLTKNKWVTQNILSHDDKGNIYFIGTGENPTETNYFVVNIKTGDQKQLTTNGTHEVSFSSDYKYWFDSYSSIEVPHSEIIYNNKGKVAKTLITAKNPYENVTIGTAEYGTIKAGDQKTDLHYRMIKPSDFDPSKKYPVLVYVYGGPHAQLVTNSWLGGASLWMYWMAEQGYIVYTLDGRGSANRGFEFESIIHRNLGDNEMDDQLEGVKFLKSKPYIDGDRIAVHGWSYGGFMTTSLMLRHPGVFTTGVAGGPVTDWKYYEIMYGERYMDRPEQNEDGYKKAALMNYVNNLEGELLLIHGTADDVVVMQHNLALVKAFIEAGVQMDFFPYPMHPHNVRGKDRIHLMTKVLEYVIENNQ